MKHTTRLGPNRYITLDSYGESRQNRRTNFLCTIFIIALVAITGGAMVGVDITDPNLYLNQQNNGNTSRPGR